MKANGSEVSKTIKFLNRHGVIFLTAFKYTPNYTVVAELHCDNVVELKDFYSNHHDCYIKPEEI